MIQYIKTMTWAAEVALGGGAPNMCTTFVKGFNFEWPYLDNYWVTNGTLCGFELGSCSPSDYRRVFRL